MKCKFVKREENGGESNETNDIRELTTAEIETKVKALKEELFNLRFQLATGQLENPTRIREVRKAIARMKTVVRECKERSELIDKLRGGLHSERT